MTKLSGGGSSVSNDLSAKGKILFEHKLGLQRLLIDRVIIGLLVAIVAFLANLAIERFKANTSDTRYFLEKRFEAATNLRSKLTSVTNAAFEHTVASCKSSPLDPQSSERFKQSISMLVAELNSSALLFTEKYLAEADRVVNIFSGAASDPSSITCDSRYFFSDTADFITERTRGEILGKADNWKGYVPLNVDKRAMDQMRAVGYFQRNLAAWAAAQPKPSK